MEQTKGDKEQFVHKLSSSLNSLVALVMTSLQVESVPNLGDLVRKMRISAQPISYSLIAVKNCGMVSAT